MAPWSGFEPDLRFILEYWPAHYAPHLLTVSFAATCVLGAVQPSPWYSVAPQPPVQLTVESVFETEPSRNAPARRSGQVRDSGDFSLHLKHAVTNGANHAETSGRFEPLSYSTTATYTDTRSQGLLRRPVAAWQAACDSMIHPRAIGPSSPRQGRFRPEDCNNFSRRRRDGAA